jgi:hypothetical protein
MDPIAAMLFAPPPFAPPAAPPPAPPPEDRSSGGPNGPPPPPPPRVTNHDEVEITLTVSSSNPPPPPPRADAQISGTEVIPASHDRTFDNQPSHCSDGAYHPHGGNVGQGRRGPFRAQRQDRGAVPLACTRTRNKHLGERARQRPIAILFAPHPAALIH